MHCAWRWILAVGAPALTALAIIAFAARLAASDRLARLEASIEAPILRWHNPRTIALFGDLSALGSSTLVTLVAATAALMWWVRDDMQAALVVTLAPAVAGGLGTLLKSVTKTERPLQAAGAWFGSSMPSNHTLMATVLYGVLAHEIAVRLDIGDALRTTVLLAALGVIGSVAASRVLLRVHHVSDVAAGLVLGAAIVAAVTLQPWAC